MRRLEKKSQKMIKINLYIRFQIMMRATELFLKRDLVLMISKKDN
jgi:hypothetical protein